MFYTSEELIQHIVSLQRCIIMANESTLALKIVPNMQHHLNTAHKQCVSCLNYCIDSQQGSTVNRGQIMKNSLPSCILEGILRKEQLYNSFTVQELLDHIVSDNHNSHKPVDSYKVHNVETTPID